MVYNFQLLSDSMLSQLVFIITFLIFLYFNRFQSNVIIASFYCQSGVQLHMLYYLPSKSHWSTKCENSLEVLRQDSQVRRIKWSISSSSLPMRIYKIFITILEGKLRGYSSMQKTLYIKTVLQENLFYRMVHWFTSILLYDFAKYKKKI